MPDDAGPSGEKTNDDAGQAGEESHDSVDEKITLTRAELDRQMADVRRGVESSMSKKFTDYDDLKAKASKLDELEEERKSELEKLQERAEKAEADRTQAEERARNALTRAAVIAAASGKVVDPEAAFVLLDRSEIVYDDDGAPTNVTELIDSLVESKPYLAASTEHHTTGEKPANQGGRGTTALTRADLKTMSPEEIDTARRKGELDHLFSPT